MAESELDLHLLELGQRVEKLLQSRGIQLADAQDAVASAYEKIIILLPSLSVYNLDGWFYRVSLNAYLDQLRKRKHEVITSTLPEGVNITSTVFAELIASLSPKDRELVSLKYYYGFSYEEIGKIMDLRTSSVKTMLARARKRLRVNQEDE